ncbi:DNA-3-methyladenine glycosylase family protein [Pararhizobium sp.]|uniref:DNA-3-methyladenine glycosylase family protein n=1 Tax=Pararhizobium sp. TaxID=1977563 RepID=UPI00271C7EF9|nr:DNA-3-methyladenine glycosylase [Pararhizobium sp.]MDO9417946.1 DNA-3-methyladenine glycosylase [Pararhizobium sp.]
MRIIRTHEDIEAGIEGLLMLDARLVHVVERAGPVPLRRSEPGYRGIAHIIVSQMVSKASAEAIWARMETAVGGAVTAETMLALSDERCREAGLSRAKADALRKVAASVLDGTLDLDAVCDMEAKQAIAEMTHIRGVGRWTAEVYLLFCAGHPDVFPVGDVALQSGIGHAFGLEVRPNARELDDLVPAWSPWRSIAARLFWAYYAREMGRSGAPVT